MYVQTFERLFHLSEVPAQYLPMGKGCDAELRVGLTTPRLERAIGVIYRPEPATWLHPQES